MTQLTYKDAGVNIDEGEALVDDITAHVERTRRPEVIGGLGGFGALFAVPKGYDEPVLVSGTDGVGTKLKLAFTLEKYDTIVFATPVYWYSMSAIMKVFFDRFSDLIKIEKETGRKFRGKSMFVISNSYDEQLDYDFCMPFRLTANYLGINYLGDKHFSYRTHKEQENIISI